MLGLVRKLEARTGTSVSFNMSIEEQLLKMEEQLAIIINNSQHANEVNKNRIAGLEQAHTDTNSAVQNNTNEILKLKDDTAMLTFKNQQLNRNVSDFEVQLGKMSKSCIVFLIC